MARLNSDNRDTMPLTDAVYGVQRKQTTKTNTPRGHGFPLSQSIPQSVQDEMYARAKKRSNRGS